LEWRILLLRRAQDFRFSAISNVNDVFLQR
jgi:hypothetical protein